MGIIEAILLGLLQGLTEFIPISSSGHLLLAHHFFGLEQDGLLFDVALHAGTLLALLVFFNKDLIELFSALFKKSQKTRLAWLLAFATIPAVIAGLLLQDAAESAFRSPLLASINLIGFGLIMIAAEKVAATRHNRTKLPDTSTSQAIAMGFAQALALIPGVSRSGSTITAGLFAGLDRVAATRFSFLLAVPITVGAILKVFVSDNAFSRLDQDWPVFIAGIAAAFLSGLLAIRFLLRFLANHRLNVFAYYRLALGGLMILILSV